MKNPKTPKQQQEIIIYLRNVKLKGKAGNKCGNLLALRQGQGQTVYNDLDTEGDGEAIVKWKL